MDISVKMETITQDDQSWLGSARGTDTARTGILQVSAFTPATHYPDGYFRSGTPVGRYTSGANSGRYGPYTSGAADGTQTLVGFLLVPVKAPALSATNIAAAILDTGRIRTAKLPIAVDAAGIASAPRFAFV